MGYSVSRSGFTTFPAMITSIAQDLVNGGFILKYSNDATGAKAIIDPLSVRVYVDGVLALKNDEYIQVPNENGTVTINFLPGFIPPERSKVTAQYSYIERRTSESTETMIGKVNGLNVDFTTSKSINVNASINMNTLKVKVNGVEQVLYVDDATTPTWDYKASVDAETRKALITFNPMSIPKDKSTFTADYQVRTNQLITGNVIGWIYDSELDNVKRTFTQTVPNYGTIELANITFHPSYRPQASDNTYCLIESFTYDPATRTVTFTLDKAPDPTKGYTGDNRNFLTQLEFYYASYATNEPLTGNADGFNDTFTTDPKKVKIDQSTFVLSIDEPDGLGGFVNRELFEGDDYSSTYNADGTITCVFNRVKADGSVGIPVNGSVLRPVFEYIKSTASNNAAPLLGIVDGVNGTFDTPIVVFGTKFTLEAGPLVDPLAATQPWRIHLDGDYVEDMQLSSTTRIYNPSGGSNDVAAVNPQRTPDVTVYADAIDPHKFLLKTSKVKKFGKFVVGTPIQLPDTGAVESYNLSKKDRDKYYRQVDTITPGMMYSLLNEAVYTLHASTEVTTEIDTNYVGSQNTVLSNLDLCPARPCSYVMSVSDHGVVVSIHTDAKDAGDGNVWFCAQRLVDAKTGAILTSGHSPVVCLYQMQPIDNDSVTLIREGTSSPQQIVEVQYEIVRKSVLNMIIIRENDVVAPTNPVPVNQHYNYIGGIWNFNKQISLSNKDEYIISIPDGLNTHRHFYPNQRVDMVGFISANVIAEGVDASVSMHGEPQARKYKAQRTTIGYTEGGRMLMLVEGGGV